MGFLGLALHLSCYLGALAFDAAASVDISMLDINTWAERARAELQEPQGDSNNGTWRGVGGSEPVSIPWQELWDAIFNGHTEAVSPLGRVLMALRDPSLESLADLMAGQEGDVCIISR